MKNAQLTRKWNMTARRIGYTLTTNEITATPLNNCWMGEGRQDAIDGLAEINALREGLGLPALTI